MNRIMPYREISDRAQKQLLMSSISNLGGRESLETALKCFRLSFFSWNITSCK